MKLTWETCACMVALTFSAAAADMPPAQQNALVKTYCAGCHTEAQPQGGLSLQKFDAADPDPALMKMLLSKLKGGAMGASGVALPDKPAQAALIEAFSAASVGFDQWTVRRPDPAIVTASVVESTAAENNYRLTVTCSVDTHEGEMQLAWAPNDSRGQTISASVDGNGPLSYQTSKGDGAAVLAKLPLPARTLTIRDLFPGETVVFPFDELPRTVSACFGPPKL